MPDMAKCVGYLFFNKDVSNEALLKETPYFKKMISEYIEKKFCYTTDKLSQLLKLISHANYRFITMVNELYANSNKPGYFENIPCNLLVKPPVDTAEAKFPYTSKATAPTVPNLF